MLNYSKIIITFISVSTVGVEEAGWGKSRSLREGTAHKFYKYVHQINVFFFNEKR